MENRYSCLDKYPGIMVCSVYDRIVCHCGALISRLLMDCSVLLPWVMLREVPVQVEIVSTPLYSHVICTDILFSRHRK